MVGAVYFLGGALGVTRDLVSMGDYLVLVPVANIVAAVPLAPGGWGLGELVYRELFGMIGVSAALGVAVSVTFRLRQLFMGLLGSPFLLMPASRDAMRHGISGGSASTRLRSSEARRATCRLVGHGRLVDSGGLAKL